VFINRLTVDGRDFFLPEPVAELKDAILQAIRAGGGYVNIPPINGGPGLDILFSPGMPVSWAQIPVGNDAPAAETPAATGPSTTDGALDNL
jgi:hypothetical protein